MCSTGQVLNVIVQNLLIDAPELISDGVATDNKDMQRDALIGVVIERALMVVELIQVHGRQESVRLFFNDFHDIVEWKEAHGPAPKGLVKDLTKLDILFDESVDLENWEQDFDKADRETAMRYLRHHFATSSLEEQCGIKSMFMPESMSEVRPYILHLPCFLEMRLD